MMAKAPPRFCSSRQNRLWSSSSADRLSWPGSRGGGRRQIYDAFKFPGAFQSLHFSRSHIDELAPPSAIDGRLGFKRIACGTWTTTVTTTVTTVTTVTSGGRSLAPTLDRRTSVRLVINVVVVVVTYNILCAQTHRHAFAVDAMHDAEGRAQVGIPRLLQLVPLVAELAFCEGKRGENDHQKSGIKHSKRSLSRTSDDDTLSSKHGRADGLLGGREAAADRRREANRGAAIAPETHKKFGLPG